MTALQLTERIWLSAFGSLPKSNKAGLQIRSRHYLQSRKMGNLPIILYMRYSVLKLWKA